MRNPFATPTAVSDVLLAFPAAVSSLMPVMAEIPEDFRAGKTVWNEFAKAWMFGLMTEPQFHMAEGVDGSLAYRHLSAILGSYEPKQEHKEFAVAYLCSQWFTKVVTAERTYEGAAV